MINNFTTVAGTHEAYLHIYYIIRYLATYAQKEFVHSFHFRLRDGIQGISHSVHLLYSTYSYALYSYKTHPKLLEYPMKISESNFEMFL